MLWGGARVCYGTMELSRACYEVGLGHVMGLWNCLGHVMRL